MSHDEIRVAIDDYLRLIEEGKPDSQTNMHELELCLDRLALSAHYPLGDIDCEDDAPRGDYSYYRQFASGRFPGLGYYNEPEHLSGEIAESGLIVGDALDDLADIARDLHEILWFFDRDCQATALFLFRFGYEYHWGIHLRSLQKYLHEYLYR